MLFAHKQSRGNHDVPFIKAQPTTIAPGTRANSSTHMNNWKNGGSRTYKGSLYVLIKAARGALYHSGTAIGQRGTKSRTKFKN